METITFAGDVKITKPNLFPDRPWTIADAAHTVAIAREEAHALAENIEYAWREMFGAESPLDEQTFHQMCDTVSHGTAVLVFESRAAKKIVATLLAPPPDA